MSKEEFQMTSFQQALTERNTHLTRSTVNTLQVNLGKLCNQACRHCHVEAGPTKTRENMNEETCDQLISLMTKSSTIKTLDITGGAPEMNPHFRKLVSFARSKNIEVIDRCNLTVLFEEGQDSTAKFLAESGTQVVASLPCYSRSNVDKQRGNGVFDKSIKGLQLLNKLGYAQEGSGLQLHLVYNPQGINLPPSQLELEQQYKKELQEDFGIQFNNLFTITNMPIKRFHEDLKRSGKLDEYNQLLINNFNLSALESVMCKELISISWDGKIFDCDFNQMLDLKVDSSVPQTIWELEDFESFNNSPIKVANHCYGCTAGAGSSCTGSLTESAPKQTISA